MTIKKVKEGNVLTISLEGRLDTTTAPQLEQELQDSLDGISDLSFNLENLSYISSAGLRVLLSAHKTMSKKGNMVVTGANEDLMDIFDVTGFVDILNIK